MNSRITKAKAYTNGEVAYISWQVDSIISSCRGFEITRIYREAPDTNTILPAWVPFKGQSNPEWQPQNTSVWPIQKLSWRDLTLRKRRDEFTTRVWKKLNQHFRFQKVNYEVLQKTKKNSRI